MIYKIVFHEAIKKDYYEAYEWYETKQAGLGERFLTNVSSKIKSISIQPDIYPLRVEGYREALVTAFPFSIVYRVYESKKEILIISVHHHKKHPMKKQRR